MTTASKSSTTLPPIELQKEQWKIAIRQQKKWLYSVFPMEIFDMVSTTKKEVRFSFIFDGMTEFGILLCSLIIGAVTDTILTVLMVMLPVVIVIGIYRWYMIKNEAWFLAVSAQGIKIKYNKEAYHDFPFNQIICIDCWERASRYNRRTYVKIYYVSEDNTRYYAYKYELGGLNRDINTIMGTIHYFYTIQHGTILG